MLKAEESKITLGRISVLKKQVADGTAALGERLLLDLEIAKAAGAKTVHEYCRVIWNHASRDVMEKVGLPKDTPIVRTMTLSEMDFRFHRLRQDLSLSLSLRNEAAEIGSALVFILPKPPSQPENETLQMGYPGRVCRFCWRTEAIRSGSKPLGFCHEHDIHAWSYSNNAHLKRLRANVARQTRLLEYFLEEGISAAGKPGLPKAVLVAKDVRVIFGKVRDQIYPNLHPMPPPPKDVGSVAWGEYVKTNYPETDCYVRQLTNDPVVLSEPSMTAQALEGRKLTDAEIIDLRYPIGAVPILRRCEAWLRLAESARRRRKLDV